MLQRLVKMINRLAEPDGEKKPLLVDEYKLAATALLVHATLVDGNADQSERTKLKQLLRDRFEVSEAEVEQFIELAEHKERSAIDLYGFTRQISQELAPDGRMEIIEMLWEIAFADGVLHEYETHLIWRVAELMHVEARDRIRLRKMVEARQKT